MYTARHDAASSTDDHLLMLISSTSNWSVELAGITGGKPRAP
jgi:hypothetical protein